MVDTTVQDLVEEVATNREEPDVQQEVLDDSQPKVIRLDDAKAGFVVGIAEDGEWIWQTFGKDASLDRLLGCLKHADRQLSLIYDTNTGRGEKRLHEVGLAVLQVGETLANKMDQLLQAAGVRRKGTDV